MSEEQRTDIQPGLRRVRHAVTRAVHRGLRRARRQPGFLCRFNHPVAPDAWDAGKGIRGWVASEAAVVAVELQAGARADRAVRLEPRADVAWHLGGHFPRQIGFRSAVPVRDWLAGRTGTEVAVTIRFADGKTATQLARLLAEPERHRAKFARFAPLLRCPDCHGALTHHEAVLRCGACAADYPCRDGVVDFLTRRTAEDFGVEATDNISAWNYDDDIVRLTQDRPDGLFLDCGAGLRRTHYPNIVNFEIVDYSSTDVLGVGEKLPFADNSMDGVISVGVLEHVREPFRCGRELTRVLKPGGFLFAAVPFLQPLHGYPHHYYNMTADGLRGLFPDLAVERQFVPPALHPIQSMRWALHAYCRGLPERERRRFERMTVREIMALPPFEQWSRRAVPVIAALGEKAQFEVASGTCLIARKPS